MWPFKKRKDVSIQDAIKVFETGAKAIQVPLYAELKFTYSKEMISEVACVLAGQVVNYLMGEDIDEIHKNAQEPTKTVIGQIKDQIPKRAHQLMARDDSTREVIVATLRMISVLKFAIIGESYMTSPQKQRVENLLVEYGREFRYEMTPDKYMALAHTYYKQKKMWLSLIS